MKSTSSPQKENGYVPIANEIMEQLVKVGLLGSELVICLWVIRKTYGFNKKQDMISLTQFEKATCLSRPTVVKALKNLQLVNMVLLVKRGDNIHQSNTYSFNKHYKTWKLVKTAKLVKCRPNTSKDGFQKLVNTAKHTKDNIQKTYTKDIAKRSSAQIPEIIKLFEEVNPACKKFYGNTTQRNACEALLDLYGFQQVKKAIAILPKTNQTNFFPTINTPLQLENKWTQLVSAILRQKQEKKSNALSVVKI